VRGILGGNLSQKDTSRAAAGWGGDRAYLLERDKVSLFVWKTVWDSPKDATDFYQSYGKVLDNKGELISEPSSKTHKSWRESGHLIITYHKGDEVFIIRGPDSSEFQQLVKDQSLLLSHLD
jgi:hypothetical protein